MIKINMGCGKRDFGEDWVHIDGGDYKHVTYHDIAYLPQYDNDVDLIYASHVIEYFDREQVVDVLLEWKRILKPEGILRLAVPNFETMATLYIHGRKDFPLKTFLGPLYGKMKMGEETIYHKTTYDFASLAVLLAELGFKNIRQWDWRSVDHGKFDDHSQAYLPKMDKENGILISLNMEAVK